MSNHAAEENSKAIYDTARDEKMSELDILKQSLEEKKRQVDDYYEQLLRLKAEFENYRRRAEKDKQNHLVWGKEEILMKQISLMDVLEQATLSVHANANIESIRKGLELIIQEFSRMLSSEGVSEIESAGKAFDPLLHDAIDHVVSDQPEGAVAGVLQKGYMMNGRVIRPAKVTVAKKAAEKDEDEDKDEDKNDKQ